MTKNLSDKSCQTFPIDWRNVQAKCPCCQNHVKVDLNYGPDCGNIVLLPVNGKQSGIESPQVTSVGNSSLTNIVSVESGGNSSLTNIVSVESGGNSSLTNIVSVESVGERLGTTFPPYSNNNHNMHDDDSELNESTSSSVSNSSMNRVIEPEVQITTLADFTPSKPLRPSSHLSLRTSSGPSRPSSGLSGPSRPSSGPSSDPSLRPCDSSFSKNDSSSALTSSAFNHFPNQGIRLKCQFHGCGMVLDGPQQLELHYKEHKGEKIQKCDWYNCNRLFSSKEKLRNHVRCRHTGERPHKCDECGKAFTSGKHLKDHSLLHTDFRPFMCEWEGCGIKFRRRHHLVAHKRVHTKERPFGCQYPGCGMKFTKTHHVKRHYETHFKSTAYKMFLDAVPVSSPGTVATESSSQPSLQTPSTALPSTPMAGYMFMS